MTDSRVAISAKHDYPSMQELSAMNNNQINNLVRPEDVHLEPRVNSESNLEEFGDLFLDVEKGYLVDEKKFDGLGNDDLDDPEVLQAV